MNKQFKEWWEKASKTLKCDQYDAYEIWQQTQKVAVPEGFVLVESKNLDALARLGGDMVKNAKYYQDECHIRGFGNSVNFIHKAMIEARERAND